MSNDNNWGGFRENAGRHKAETETVGMKVAVHIAKIISEHASKNGMTKVKALCDIWDNHFSHSDDELITPVELEALRNTVIRQATVINDVQTKAQVTIDQQQAMIESLKEQVGQLMVERDKSQNESGDRKWSQVQGVIGEVEKKRAGKETRNWVEWLRFLDKVSVFKID